MGAVGAALYDSAAFEPLGDEAWQNDRVEAATRAIVEDAVAAFDPDRLWPVAPADLAGSFRVTPPFSNVYNGAAGVLWSLAALARRGRANGLDLAAAARRASDCWLAEADYELQPGWPGHGHDGLLLSQTGIALVLYCLAPDPALADELAGRIAANLDSTADELMWGTPGTMVAALSMLELTGDLRFEELWLASARRLWQRRLPGHLWWHSSGGGERPLLGLLHGSSGAALALLQGSRLLGPDLAGEITAAASDVLARTAVVCDGLANWPVAEGDGLAAPNGEIRVQWCHGGSGIVCAASRYLDLDLLVAGGELAWLSGPLRKGPSLCHGTAGNGYALLKLFERTGDELWLDRARRFALHALRQVGHARRERGRGHYSLWTGDLGAALFAADCVDAHAALPTVDPWWP